MRRNNCVNDNNDPGTSKKKGTRLVPVFNLDEKPAQAQILSEGLRDAFQGALYSLLFTGENAMRSPSLLKCSFLQLCQFCRRAAPLMRPCDGQTDFFTRSSADHLTIDRYPFEQYISQASVEAA